MRFGKDTFTHLGDILVQGISYRGINVSNLNKVLANGEKLLFVTVFQAKLCAGKDRFTDIRSNTCGIVLDVGVFNELGAYGSPAPVGSGFPTNIACILLGAV